MIRIRYHRTNSGLLCGFTVTGHSGSAPAGEDIVCAAVSAIAITGANALESVAHIRTQHKVRDGYLKVMLPTGLPPGSLYTAQIILRTVKQGFQDIAAEHPAFVRILPD